jgi:hypothetical protein
LYGAGYDNIDDLFILDPVTDTVDLSVSTAGITTGTKKWVDGISHPDGRLIFNPSGSAAGYLIVDPRTTPITLSSFGANYQVRGGALGADGVVYSTVYQDFDYLRSFNPDTPSASTVAYSRHPGPPSWTEGTLLDKLAGYQWGMTKAPNTGKMYGTPWGPHRVLIFDPSTGVVSWSATNLTGGTTVGSAFSTPAYFGKYGGKGVYVPANQCIYIMPRSGNTILKIDTLTDATTEISLPAALQSSSAQRAMSAVLGPDGKVYSTVWSMPYLFWIDPATDEIGYTDVSATMALADDGNGGTGYWTYGAATENAIYYVCGGATKVLKLEFDGYPAPTDPLAPTSSSSSSSSTPASF